MITEYFRPKTIEEAITLKNKYPGSKYVAGGLSFQNLEENIILIDLQKIPNYYEKKKNILEIGSTKTLEDILQSFTDFKDLTTAIRIEASKNLRNQITLGGLIKKANGRSPFLCCLTAFDSWIYLEPGNKKVKLNEFLLIREANRDLITKIEIKIPERFRFESIARSPLDKPIVCCSSAKYDEKQLLSIGGFGNLPLVINSGIVHKDKVLLKFLKEEIRDDQWASSEYRVSIALTLINRLLTD
jgi:CO/xanthine dehydrogenase FAD-binding subunit